MVHYFDGPMHKHARLGNSQHNKKSRKKKRQNGAAEEWDHDAPQDDAQDEAQGDARDGEGSDDAFSPPAEPLAETSLKHPNVGVPKQTLKRQHYHALNTILHRCLAEGDYARASRALGTLLRFDVRGRTADIRKDNLWALAAEILLRRDLATNSELGGTYSPQSELDAGVVQTSITHLQSEPMLSLDGFRDAKQLLDRLILQHPVISTESSYDNARQFYPAMLSFWVLQIQTEAQRSVRMLQSAGVYALSSKATAEMRSQQVKLRELERAREVQTAVTELMVSPPYDTDDVLLHFRGQIDSWVTHLALVAPKGV